MHWGRARVAPAPGRRGPQPLQPVLRRLLGGPRCGAAGLRRPLRRLLHPRGLVVERPGGVSGPRGQRLRRGPGPAAVAGPVRADAGGLRPGGRRRRGGGPRAPVRRQRHERHERGDRRRVGRGGGERHRGRGGRGAAAGLDRRRRGRVQRVLPAAGQPLVVPRGAVARRPRAPRRRAARPPGAGGGGNAVAGAPVPRGAVPPGVPAVDRCTSAPQGSARGSSRGGRLRFRCVALQRAVPSVAVQPPVTAQETLVGREVFRFEPHGPERGGSAAAVDLVLWSGFRKWSSAVAGGRG